jgi:hypothetical protein
MMMARLAVMTQVTRQWLLRLLPLLLPMVGSIPSVLPATSARVTIIPSSSSSSSSFFAKKKMIDVYLFVGESLTCIALFSPCRLLFSSLQILLHRSGSESELLVVVGGFGSLVFYGEEAEMVDAHDMDLVDLVTAGIPSILLLFFSFSIHSYFLSFFFFFDR